MARSSLRSLTLSSSCGDILLTGGSRAGEGTLVILPQFRLALDIGRTCRALPPVTTACISHGHTDHLAGLAYWAGQRYLQSMGPATLCVPEAIAEDIAGLLAVHARLEGGKPYDVAIQKVSDGAVWPLRRDLQLEFFDTDHWVPTLGSQLLWTRNRLLPELSGAEPGELAQLRKNGTPITSAVITPLVAYGADTGPKVFSDHRILDAEIVLLECSFWHDNDLERARAFGHLHISDLIALAPQLQCRHLVLLHASRRNRLHEVEAIMTSELAPLFSGDLHHLFIDWE